MRFSRFHFVLLTVVAFILGVVGSARADAPPAPPPPAATATVTLRGHEGLMMMSLSPTTHQWDFVCFAPCNQALPLDREYRLGGEVQPTTPFRLRAKPGDHVVLTARQRQEERASRAPGIVVTSIGGAVVLVGLVIAIDGLFSCVSYDGGPSCNPQQRELTQVSLERFGGIVAGVGAAVALVGTAILVSAVTEGSPEVSVSQTLGQLFTDPRPRADVGDVRAPRWNDPRMGGATLAPSATSVPLLTQRF
jgi:hypothetical protein